MKMTDKVERSWNTSYLVSNNNQDQRAQKRPQLNQTPESDGNQTKYGKSAE